MLYELRVYHVAPGKLPALLNRFENASLKFWEKYGICQVGFWTTQIGESSNDLCYMLQWQSLAEREQKWGALTADSEWLRVRAETEKDGPLVLSIGNQILAPTSFSKMR